MGLRHGPRSLSVYLNSRPQSGAAQAPAADVVHGDNGHLEVSQTRTVNIAELKDKLSAYLTYAKAGETVIIRNRNRPVAKLVPFVAEGLSEHELKLVATGQIRLPEKHMDVEAFLRMPRARMTYQAEACGAATQALLDDRNEGRSVVWMPFGIRVRLEHGRSLPGWVKPILT